MFFMLGKHWGFFSTDVIVGFTIALKRNVQHVLIPTYNAQL